MTENKVTTDELRTAVKVLQDAQEYSEEIDENMAKALFSDAERYLVGFEYGLTGDTTVLDERQ